MRLLGLQAITPQRPAPPHRVYPYLLKGLTIDYIPVRCGCLYLVAIMDWASRIAGLAGRTPSTRASASKPSTTRWPAGPSSTPTRAAVRAAAGTWPPASRSRWTAGAATTSLSSGCGVLQIRGRHLHELADGLKARRVIGEWIGFYTTERTLRRANASRGTAAPGLWIWTFPRRAHQAAEHRHGNQGPRNQAYQQPETSSAANLLNRGHLRSRWSTTNSWIGAALAGSMANKSNIVIDLRGWRTPSVSGEELQALGKSGPRYTAEITRGLPVPRG